MSIFPTKVLIATDGSKDSQLAARTAVELAQKTSSELHVVYVLPWPDQGMRDLWGFDASARCGRSQGARETEGAGRGHRDLGRDGRGDPLRGREPGDSDSGRGRGARGGLRGDGQDGLRRAEESLDGQHLRLRRQARRRPRNDRGRIRPPATRRTLERTPTSPPLACIEWGRHLLSRRTFRLSGIARVGVEPTPVRSPREGT